MENKTTDNIIKRVVFLTIATILNSVAIIIIAASLL